MLPTEIRVGWIFRYAYLWDWQHREGRDEGDKDRPYLVLAIVTTTEDGAPVVRVPPITHAPPGDPADAIEIPAMTKARLGLDEARSCIVLTKATASPGRGRTCGPSIVRPATTARFQQSCSPRSNAAS